LISLCVVGDIASHKYRHVGDQNPDKSLNGQIVSWRFMNTLHAVMASRGNKGGCAIMALKDKLPTEQLITSHIGRPNKFRKDFDLSCRSRTAGVAAQCESANSERPPGPSDLKDPSCHTWLFEKCEPLQYAQHSVLIPRRSGFARMPLAFCTVKGNPARR
jgi:hypothetical protein